jgi:hypothetical protein
MCVQRTYISIPVPTYRIRSVRAIPRGEGTAMSLQAFIETGCLSGGATPRCPASLDGDGAPSDYREGRLARAGVDRRERARGVREANGAVPACKRYHGGHYEKRHDQRAEDRGSEGSSGLRVRHGSAEHSSTGIATRSSKPHALGLTNIPNLAQTDPGAFTNGRMMYDFRPRVVAKRDRLIVEDRLTATPCFAICPPLGRVPAA